MASAAIGTIITGALTAYSAVTAIKALKEGNILGAVMGGFGAYMGYNSLAGQMASGGDVLAADAMADTGGSFASNLNAVEGIDTGMSELFSGAGNLSQFTTDALAPISQTGGVLSGQATQLAGAGVDNSLLNGVGAIGTSNEIIQSGGFMDSLTNGWNELVRAGEAVVDDLGNLISTKDGSILAKAGEAVGGTGNLMKLGGMALNYMGKEKAIDAQQKAADKAYARAQQEAARKRRSVGSAPTYVYDFGGRRESVA